VQFAIAGLVIAANIVIYGWLLYRWCRSRTTEVRD
jgi:hypothetical protein